jgi:hypothetical protein
MKRIIWQNAAGGVSVLSPAPDCGLTIEQIATRDVPKGKSYQIVDTANIPPDRTFRNAWEYDGEKIIVSLSKAQEITKARLRAERVPLLAEQDVAFQRALETGADTVAIVAEKQRLRDITKLADKCSTLDELKELQATL